MLGLIFLLGGLMLLAWAPYIIYVARKTPKAFLAENQQDLPNGCAYAVVAVLLLGAGPGGVWLVILGLRLMAGG